MSWWVYSKPDLVLKNSHTRVTLGYRSGSSPVSHLQTMILLILVEIGLVLVLAGAVISNRKIKNMRDAGIYPESGKEKEEDVLRLLKSGNKILAIKCYREIHKIGLKEAKDAVELLEKHRSQP